MPWGILPGATGAVQATLAGHGAGTAAIEADSPARTGSTLAVSARSAWFGKQHVSVGDR